ncbi:MAG: hypothetical protein ICV66_01565 [Chitinophagaceae bacterium]|nr:hypothetical protein [Chitinophagaceae bacterium]
MKKKETITGDRPEAYPKPSKADKQYKNQDEFTEQKISEQPQTGKQDTQLKTKSGKDQKR